MYNMLYIIDIIAHDCTSHEVDMEGYCRQGFRASIVELKFVTFAYF